MTIDITFAAIFLVVATVGIVQSLGSFAMAEQDREPFDALASMCAFLVFLLIWWGAVAFLGRAMIWGETRMGGDPRPATARSPAHHFAPTQLIRPIPAKFHLTRFIPINQDRSTEPSEHFPM